MTVFVGWIRAPENDRRRLMDLGVYGRMRYNRDARCFEHCRVQTPAVKRLMAGYPNFWPPSFTAIDAAGKALPYEYQLCWFLNSGTPSSRAFTLKQRRGVKLIIAMLRTVPIHYGMLRKGGEPRFRAFMLALRLMLAPTRFGRRK